MAWRGSGRAATTGIRTGERAGFRSGSVMHPGRPSLRPPFVERPAADAEIGAHLRDGELVRFWGADYVISAGHDGAPQPQCRTGRPTRAVQPASTAACPW